MGVFYDVDIVRKAPSPISSGIRVRTRQACAPDGQRARTHSGPSPFRIAAALTTRREGDDSDLSRGGGRSRTASPLTTAGPRRRSR
jgi:hypothetical protein